MTKSGLIANIETLSLYCWWKKNIKYFLVGDQICLPCKVLFFRDSSRLSIGFNISAQNSAIELNTFYNFDKYILHFAKKRLNLRQFKAVDRVEHLSSKVCYWDGFISWFEQIHLAILTFWAWVWGRILTLNNEPTDNTNVLLNIDYFCPFQPQLTFLDI